MPIQKYSVFVTGAAGFVGQVLCHALAARGHLVHAAIRSLDTVPTLGQKRIHWIAVGDLSPDTDWHDLLQVFMQDQPELPHVIIHCAARAHVMNETASDVVSIYRETNVGVTRSLAQAAAAIGVNRLVFLSSIKVNGERTQAGNAFRYDDPPMPEDAYGLSKHEAEEALWVVANSSELEVTVVRSPLVYGPGVKGNLLRLMGLVSQGLPLPFASINNRRSMVGIDNLVDLLICCVQHPDAIGQTFLASDDEDLSTPGLLCSLGAHMNRETRIFPLPVSVLKLLGSVTGKQAEVVRLTESLQVDCSHTQAVLGWKPPVQTQRGLKEMVDWYLSYHKGNA